MNLKRQFRASWQTEHENQVRRSDRILAKRPSFARHYELHAFLLVTDALRGADRVRKSRQQLMHDRAVQGDAIGLVTFQQKVLPSSVNSKPRSESIEKPSYDDINALRDEARHGM
jgi:hypothetical protein